MKMQKNTLKGLFIVYLLFSVSAFDSACISIVMGSGTVSNIRTSSAQK